MPPHVCICQLALNMAVNWESVGKDVDDLVLVEKKTKNINCCCLEMKTNLILKVLNQKLSLSKCEKTLKVGRYKRQNAKCAQVLSPGSNLQNGALLT